MTAQKIKAKMVEIIGSKTTVQLCEMFEITNIQNDEAIPEIRGLIMDELEKRDPVAFEAWMDEKDFEKMDRPSFFYGVAA